MPDETNLIDKKILMLKKRNQLHFFSDSELKIAKKRSEDWGYKKFSDFVINALVYDRILCIKKVYLDEKTTVSLNKIGNNFNQISKNLNGNDKDLNVLIPLFEELKAQLVELNQRLKS